MVKNRIDITSARLGYFDIVYSPDDGGWYADLLFNRECDPPVFQSAEAAKQWAIQNGGKKKLT